MSASTLSSSPEAVHTHKELLFKVPHVQVSLYPKNEPKPKSELIFKKMEPQKVSKRNDLIFKVIKSEGTPKDTESAKSPKQKDHDLLFKVAPVFALNSSLAISLQKAIANQKIAKPRQEAPITKASMIDQHGIQKQETKYTIKDMMRLKPSKTILTRMRPAPSIPQTPEGILHEIQSILNKLTDTSVVSGDLMIQIVALTKALKDRSAVVSIIYPKSISERKSTAMYVQICQKLAEEVGDSFTTALVDMCTADFNDRMKKRNIPAVPIDTDEQFADFTAEKNREAGNLIIIAELFKRSLLTESLVKSFLNSLSDESAFLEVPKARREQEAGDQDMTLKLEYAERSFECLINLLDALCGCQRKLVEPYIKKITDLVAREQINIRLDTLAGKLLKRNWNEPAVIPLDSRRMGMSKPDSESERTGAVGVASSGHVGEYRPATQVPKQSMQTRQPLSQSKPQLPHVFVNTYGDQKPKLFSPNSLFQKKEEFDVEKFANSFVEMFDQKKSVEEVLLAADALKGTVRSAVSWTMLSIACNRDAYVRKAVVSFSMVSKEKFSPFMFLQNVLQVPPKQGEHAAELVSDVFATALLIEQTTEESVCDVLKTLSKTSRTTAQDVLPLLLSKMKKESLAAAQSLFSNAKMRLKWVKEDTLSNYLKEAQEVDEKEVDSLSMAVMELSLSDPLAPARKVFGDSCVGDVRKMADLSASLLAMRTDSAQTLLPTLLALVVKSDKWSYALLDGACLRFNENGEDVAETVRWLMNSEVVSSEAFINWADVETPSVDRRNVISHLLEIEEEARRATEWREEEDESDE